jgi:hypothetical protein
MAEYTVDLPPGYGIPTVDLATDLLPAPTMDAIASSPQLSATFVSVFGVIPTGTAAGDVAAINAAVTLASASGGIVRLQKSPGGSGAFLINQKITLPGSVAIGFEMAPGTTMQATAAMTAMIEKPAGGPAYGLSIGPLDLDCNRLADRGVDLEQATLARLVSFQIKNWLDTGVELGRQGGLVLEITWDGATRLVGIDENRSGASNVQMPEYGVKCGAQVTDSHFTNVVVKNVRKGFRDLRGANIWDNAHVFGYPVLGNGTADAAQSYVTEIGFELIGGLIRLINCHPDTAIVGIYNEGVQNLSVGMQHYWPATFDAGGAAIVPYKVYGGDLTVIGSNLRLPSTSSLTGPMSELSGTAAKLTVLGARFYGTGWTAPWSLLSSASAPLFLGCSWPSGNIPTNLDAQGGILRGGTGSGVSGAAASNRDLVFRTVDNARWTLRADNAAESGGNAGSALQLNAQKDDGTFLFNVAQIQRYNGVFIHQRAVLAPVVTTTVSADGAVTLDAALSNDHIVYLDANVTATTIGMASSTGSTTIASGHKLAISIVQGAAGAKTFAWPTNCRFASNASPGTPNIGRMATVHFRYRSGFWLEVARTIDVPTA